MFGKKNWFFPDAELPPMLNNPDLPGHESVIVLNPNKEDASVTLTLYFTDKDPIDLPAFEVKAGRVVCVRNMEGKGILGTDIPVGEQYAISVASTVEVVAQYGRLDMRSGPMAFYTTPGYAE